MDTGMHRDNLDRHLSDYKEAGNGKIHDRKKIRGLGRAPRNGVKTTDGPVPGQVGVHIRNILICRVQAEAMLGKTGHNTVIIPDRVTIPGRAGIVTSKVGSNGTVTVIDLKKETNGDHKKEITGSRGSECNVMSRKQKIQSQKIEIATLSM